MNKENQDPKGHLIPKERKKRQHLHFNADLVGQVAEDHPDKWLHSEEKDELF